MLGCPAEVLPNEPALMVTTSSKPQGMFAIDKGMVDIMCDTDNRRLVNAREVHRACEVGKDFSNWIKDWLDKLELVEDQDYVEQVLLAKNGEQDAKHGGSNRKDYYLTVKAAKLLAVKQNTPIGNTLARHLVDFIDDTVEAIKEKGFATAADISPMPMTHGSSALAKC